MHTPLAPEFAYSREGLEAQALLRQCVHCGFCTAACPTYQIGGEACDSPRGRIDLVKQVFEGAAPSRLTQQHLDRCLTCRACETACPSGVEFGRIVGLGREAVEERVLRPWRERATRALLRHGLTSPLFASALKVGQWVRPWLPAALKAKVPPRAASHASAHRWPTRSHTRKVLLHMGCVQPALAPNINSATARVLDAIGIQTIVADDAGCCGALREHLSDLAGARADARRNIDAWWPAVSAGDVQAIVSSASGCALGLHEYGRLLAGDADYAERAERIAALAVDVSHFLPELAQQLAASLPAAATGVVAVHAPCTLQHGLKQGGALQAGLAALGAQVATPRDDHLCCGAAGTYSLLQPGISGELTQRKAGTLRELEAQTVLSANIGCLQQLASVLPELRVQHWVEWLDERLQAAAY